THVRLPAIAECGLLGLRRGGLETRYLTIGEVTPTDDVVGDVVQPLLVVIVDVANVFIYLGVSVLLSHPPGFFHREATRLVAIGLVVVVVVVIACTGIREVMDFILVAWVEPCHLKNLGAALVGEGIA